MNQATTNVKYSDFLNSLENDDYILLLQTDDGLASCSSNTYVNKDTDEPITVIPVWSSGYSQEAESNLTGEWEDYSVVELPMDVFLTELLPYLAQEGVFIGINWGADLDGLEIDPIDVFRDLGLIEDFEDEELKTPQNDA